MIRRILVLLSCATAAALAQSKAAEPAKSPQKSVVVEVKYGDVTRIANVLSASGVSVRSDSGLRVIALSGDAASVNSLEAAIKKMDVPAAPAPNVELTIYLVSGTLQEGPAEAIPQELTATVKQLSSVFAYKGYRLIDTVVLRNRDGQGGQANGVIPGGPGNSSFQFSFRSAAISGANPRIIRIDGLHFDARMVKPSNTSESRIVTDLDLREGQKVVVGKANGDADTALILVLSAKVIE